MRSLESIEQTVVVAQVWLVIYTKHQLVYILQPTPKTHPILMTVTFTSPLRAVIFRINNNNNNNNNNMKEKKKTRSSGYRRET